MSGTYATIIIVVAVAALGVLAGFIARKLVAEGGINAARNEAQKIREEAEREATERRREASIEAKEEVHRLRQDAERELSVRRTEVQEKERRMTVKEESLDRKGEGLERRSETLDQKERDLDEARHAIKEREEEIRKELERVAKLTTEEARQVLLNQVEEELQGEIARRIREAEAEIREEGDKRAKNILALAIERYAADHVAESTVSAVALPSDDMKGRIIGREGRNIRAFENMTGIDVIIDDTPEAVVVSGFDPIRREIARISLERLVADGRIHPARIEEVVGKVQKEMEDRIREEGEQAAYDVGIHDLHPELVKLMGRLKFRTSYGQNVLQHSVEVAHIAGMIAVELGCNVAIARRGGFLHDIGKAVTHEAEGTHLELGIDLLRKYKETDEVVWAMEAHHGAEPKTVEAVIVTSADAISAARPGARRESLELYIKRLRKLEEIANAFEGVEKTYAISAGREIRIIVKPDQVDDQNALRLSREIARKIEKELTYPGQIRVTVIRETRSIDYAK